MDVLKILADISRSQIAEEIDREFLESFSTRMLTEGQQRLVGFFCAIGPAASAVLEDMAIEGRTWPGCEPSLRDVYRKPKHKRTKSKHRRSLR